MPTTLIYWNMVLRIQEIKASKRCTKIKIGNHVVGPADRSKENKSMSEVSCSKAALFTYSDRSMTAAAQGIITSLCEIKCTMRCTFIFYKWPVSCRIPQSQPGDPWSHK